MTATGNGGIYSPLKQLVTDSESEEDGAKSSHLNNENYKIMDINSGLQSPKNNQYSFSDGDEGTTNLNTMETTLDNVSFLQSDASNRMSIKRRILFVLSILLCVFSVIVFLFVIPCSSNASCSSSEWRDKTTSWQFPYDDIELTGVIQVVDGVISGSKNLLFMYRGNHMQHTSNSTSVTNGVVLIVGNSGKIGWYTREERVPTDINCNLPIVNKDGQKNCILTGTKGLVAALNPLSGVYNWYNIHKPNKIILDISAIEFPVLFKDMDDDDTPDLLATVILSPRTTQNTLVTISGATGCVIGELIHIEECLHVHKLSIDNSHNVSYLCKNETKEAIRILTYAQYYKRLMKAVHTIKAASLKKENLKEVIFPLKKTIGNKQEVFRNGNGKLIVENSWDCPESCKATLHLTLEHKNVSWEYSADHVLAMKPSAFAFANSIRGFVLKICQWNRAHVAKDPKNLYEVVYNKINDIPQNILMDKSKLNVSSIFGSIKYTNFTAYEISERIVLICFDNKHTHIVNVSQTEIIQICVRENRFSSERICQPDLDYQEKSLIITDLDGDKSHELVSYHSTFLPPKDHSLDTLNAWTLRSVVKVIRLENELPKLFTRKR